MSGNSYCSTLISQFADSTALTGTQTPTTILPTSAVFTLPANYLYYPGQMLIIKAGGRISNVITNPGTLAFSVMLGAVVAATSGALALNIVAKSNVTWELEWKLVLRGVGGGTTGTFMHTGEWSSESVIGSPLPSAGGSGTLMIPASAPAVGTGFDCTASQAVNLFGTWSLNNANSIQTHWYSLESKG